MELLLHNALHLVSKGSGAQRLDDVCVKACSEVVFPVAFLGQSCNSDDWNALSLGQGPNYPQDIGTIAIGKDQIAEDGCWTVLLQPRYSVCNPAEGNYREPSPGEQHLHELANRRAVFHNANGQSFHEHLLRKLLLHDDNFHPTVAEPSLWRTVIRYRLSGTNARG